MGRSRDARPGRGTEANGTGAAALAGPSIRSHDLTHDFSTVRAVDGLTLSVPRGSVFGFLGPNGAGKTTTIRLLLGLVAPTRGRAEVLGFDPVSQGAEVRSRCGVLLEHSGLVERMTAADNLEFHGRIWRLAREQRRTRIRQLLANLGLWDRRDERVGSWSRGMKQKLAIARALLHRPELVFLDEPTAGLDPIAAVSLREDLARLARQEGVTVFLSTHNLAEAERLCDRVGVIREGRLLAEGSPAEIRRMGHRPRLRIAGRGFTDNLVEHLRGRPEVAQVVPRNGVLLLDLRGGAATAPLVSFLVRMGAEVEEVSRITDTLEDVFLELVRGGTVAGGSWLVGADPEHGTPAAPRLAGGQA